MPKSKKIPEVDAHLKTNPWQKELEKLRSIILETPMIEELKWGKPCYTFQGANLIMIYGLKKNCALAFFKGVLLKDPHGVLIKPGPNSQAGRWIEFTRIDEIVKMKAIIKAYILESIEAEKSGLKVEYKKTPEPIPEELQAKFDKNAAFKTAFAKLTPGRQRGYILYFNGAKQSKTREARIEKHVPHILKGQGLMDR